MGGAAGVVPSKAKAFGKPVRRRKASPIARLRPFWVLFAIALLTIAVIGTFAVFWPGFDPKEVEIAGNRVVTRAEILQQADISPDRNLWLQNAAAIQQRVERLPYIATARVHRFFPAYVLIGVSERAPFAFVRDADAKALVDHDLRVLENPAHAAFSTLPVFTVRGYFDAEPGKFLNVPSVIALRDGYDAMVAAHVVPTALALDRFGGLVATVRGNIQVLLGDGDDLPKKLALIDPILAQIVRKQRHVEAIDLRAPNTPVLVYSH
jgi:cell division septal protein FtsQ